MLQSASRSDAKYCQLSPSTEAILSFDLTTKLLQQARGNAGSIHLVERSRDMGYHKRTGMTETRMLSNEHNLWICFLVLMKCN